jgi:hypothetical protein
MKRVFPAADETQSYCYLSDLPVEIQNHIAYFLNIYETDQEFIARANKERQQEYPSVLDDVELQLYESETKKIMITRCKEAKEQEETIKEAQEESIVTIKIIDLARKQHASFKFPDCAPCFYNVSPFERFFANFAYLGSKPKKSMLHVRDIVSDEISEWLLDSCIDDSHFVAFNKQETKAIAYLGKNGKVIDLTFDTVHIHPYTTGGSNFLQDYFKGKMVCKSITNSVSNES